MHSAANCVGDNVNISALNLDDHNTKQSLFCHLNLPQKSVREFALNSPLVRLKQANSSTNNNQM